MIKYKALAAALMMTVTSAAAALPTANAAGSYDMNVSVNLAGEKKEISPYIYGINEYGNRENYKNVAVNAVRQGGNRMVAYNWENNASNAGADWKHSSDNNLSNSNDPADCVQVLSNDAEKYGIDYKMTTLQLCGYVAADKDGAVTEAEAAPSDRWNEVVLTKGSAFDETPDLTDGKVYMDEYLNYIINTLGDSTSSTGIQGYSLDNEPALWSSTHPRIHPGLTTIEELHSKSVEMAKAVKQLDPNAEIFGPALYGYTAYDHLDDDDTSNEWENIKSANNYHWYLDCYLDEMKQASDEAGVRLLDVLDIHYYSESARVGVEDRLQSVRTLYEKGFAENSWIGQWCQENVPILPTIQASIDKYYPGTKLAVTEYNFGGEDISGTIAQAEALGCFADAGVYMASIWGGNPYQFAGINLYTNYDGEGSSFGDTLVEAETEDVSLATAYAAIDGADDSNVTLVLSNKDMNNTENAVISLEGTNTNYKSATVYAITQDSSDIRVIDVQNDITNNTVTVELPPLSVAQIVISDEESGEDIYEEPDITVKEVKYNISELELSENGYPVIPLGDKEHLVKAVINSTATCSSGASWYGGGGALTFNQLLPKDGGNATWGAKSFSFGAGTADSTILFDDFFTDGNQDVIEASIGDTYTEFQGGWWKSSSNDEKGADVSVTYNSITLVYEYDNTQTEATEGDINLDGELSVADLVMLQQHLMRRSALTAEQATVSDLNKDNVTDVFDMVLLRKKLTESNN